MCCCGQPTINGEPGYRWSPGDPPSVHPVSPPTLEDGDRLLFDEPGRCGGQDSHSYHYRVTSRMLLVRHGGGEERIRLANATMVIAALNMLDSSGARSWLLNAIYHAQADARRAGFAAATAAWQQAAAEKRIKVRKVRGKSDVRVEMAPREEESWTPW
jgi:hypothetical protein